MKFRMLLSALLLAVGMVSVAKGADTPTEVVKKAFAATKALDYATACKYYDGEMKKNMEIGAQRFAAMKAKADSGDENMKKALEMMKAMMASYEIEVKSEKIDGDFAELVTVVTMNGTPRENKGYLRKVNGEWKMISPADYAKAKGGK